MAEWLSTLSMVSFAIAGICFALAIFFWFFFKIPKVIGDLSGRTARKSIAQMRMVNEVSGSKAHKESTVNAQRGKLTASINRSVVSEKRKALAYPVQQRPETGLLMDNQMQGHAVQSTSVLESETTDLLTDENATVPLHTLNQSKLGRPAGLQLTMVEDIVLIHTDEVIEC